MAGLPCSPGQVEDRGRSFGLPWTWRLSRSSRKQGVLPVFLPPGSRPRPAPELWASWPLSAGPTRCPARGGRPVREAETLSHLLPGACLPWTAPGAPSVTVSVAVAAEARRRAPGSLSRRRRGAQGPGLPRGARAPPSPVSRCRLQALPQWGAPPGPVGTRRQAGGARCGLCGAGGGSV